MKIFRGQCSVVEIAQGPVEGALHDVYANGIDAVDAGDPARVLARFTRHVT